MDVAQQGGERRSKNGGKGKKKEKKEAKKPKEKGLLLLCLRGNGWLDGT